MVENWTLSKIAFIFFRGRMLNARILKWAQAVKLNLCYQLEKQTKKGKRFDGHFVYFIVLGV